MVTTNAEGIKRESKEKILVESVKGNEAALPGEKVTYTVERYNISNVEDSDKQKVRWAVKVDNKQLPLPVRGESVTITIKEEWAGKEIFVMPYMVSPTPKVAVTTKVAAKENIIVIGTQQHNSDWIANVFRREVAINSKLMFVHQALRRVVLNKRIPWTILFCTEGYTDNQKKKIEETFLLTSSDDKTVRKFVNVSKVDNIVNYINYGNIDGVDNKNKIIVARLLFYSHGIVKEILPWMGAWGTGDSFNIQKAEKMKSDAFTEDALIYSFSCRTGLGNTAIDKTVYKNEKTGEKHNLLLAESLAQKMANATDTTVYAYLKRTWYGDTLFTNDEYDFMDAYDAYRNKTTPERPNVKSEKKYNHLLKNGPNEKEIERYTELDEVKKEIIIIDSATFLARGALHPVRAADTPTGLPDDMKTYKKI